jgi:amino acid permease
MVFVQVFMALYILLFFPNMDGDNTTILDQVSKNQFSGEMVITLLIMIGIMILDRYVYKSKSFVEYKDGKH